MAGTGDGDGWDESEVGPFFQEASGLFRLSMSQSADAAASQFIPSPSWQTPLRFGQILHSNPVPTMSEVHEGHTAASSDYLSTGPCEAIIASMAPN